MGQEAEQGQSLHDLVRTAARCVAARGGDTGRAMCEVNTVLATAQKASDKKGTVHTCLVPSVTALHKDTEAWKSFFNAIKRIFEFAGGKGTLSLKVERSFVQITAT